MKSYYQSHTCDGYSAKVTIEWTAPEDVDYEYLTLYQAVEDKAAEVLSFSGPKMRELVELMRGHCP